jgi:inorganic triphosphatase YgiF
MGREFELKFKATFDALAQIRALWQDWEEISMETTYFDTPSRSLSERRVTLRLRMENGVSVCTVKTPLPGNARGEWECHSDSIDDGLGQLLQLGAPKEIGQIAAEGLQRYCGAKFIRYACEIALDGATAELALDHGILLGGEKEMPLCEVEVELKSGSEEAVVAFAAKLSQQYGLRPEKKSKFRRAMELAEGVTA